MDKRARVRARLKNVAYMFMCSYYTAWYSYMNEDDKEGLLLVDVMPDAE